MPDLRRRGVLPQRRRRRDDEGEDESSTAGDLDDISISEGSALSNGDEEVDVEGSEVSVEDEDARMSTTDTKVLDPAINAASTQASSAKGDIATSTTPRGSVRASTNGLQHVEAADTDQGTAIDDYGNSGEIASRATASTPQLSQSQESSIEKARRDHMEYIRQKNSNPAFVPNRGGFFLHDDRSGSAGSPYGRPFPRGRGRGFNGGFSAGRGYGQPMTGPTDQPWAHDLHETVNKSVFSPPAPAKETPATFQIPTAKAAPTAPNRTFSISTILGNVTIQVYLPGMDRKKTFQNLVKRQHTLLPQHRPPLRRDKPVRISIPDEEPRYIFPSTERSFIFIPRAMRPNQQIYTRGRGRGSYQGSRRPSILGSAYTPSIAMSRRSSLGGVGSTGVHTPTDGNIPRGPMLQNFNRPIVRMPISSLPPSVNNISTGAFIPLQNTLMSAEQHNSGPTMLHSPPVSLPMHQPRPQKTVSVAEIESPTVKAPQQQQEQPFHQQMPPGVSLTDGPMAQQGQAQPNLSMSTPLSHIPEGAVYAQPFQPYPVYPQHGFYSPAYPGGPMMFQVAADPYGMAMGGPVLPAQFTPGQTFVPASQSSEAGMQQSAMAHETNGMVYYYDQSQFSADGSQMSQYPPAVGGGMVGFQPPNAYYYPPMPGGMYYGAGQ